jgi:protein TonB
MRDGRVGEYPIARIYEIRDKGALAHFVCSRAMLEPEAQSQFVAPSTTRLVIRVKLPQQPPPRPARVRSSRRALVMMIAALAALLGWFVIRTFSVDRPPPAAATNPPSPTPATQTTTTNSTAARPTIVAPAVLPQPDPPTSAIDEVIPEVPQSALNTIRGTVRVSVRVSVDKQGSVVDAAAEDRGPSRYFERLAVGASKKWTFTPAKSKERREMLLKFNFTREGATAAATAVNE